MYKEPDLTPEITALIELIDDKFKGDKYVGEYKDGKSHGGDSGYWEMTYSALKVFLKLQ